MIHTRLKLRAFALQNDRTRHCPTLLEDFSFGVSGHVATPDTDPGHSVDNRLADAQRILEIARRYGKAA